MITRPRSAAIAAVVAAMTTALAAGVQRETATQQAGTAVISGVVVTTDSPAVPVRRAIVSLQGGSSNGRHAITDDQGRFTFDALPTGRYILSASRRSYVTIAFGAVRPGQPGAPLIVESGQRIDKVSLLLARGAAITGSVRDASGETIASLDVRVEAATIVGNARPVTFVTQTDDQGVYRIFGLPAGSYLVSVRPRTARADLLTPSDAEVDEALRELKARSAAGVKPPVNPSAIRNIPSVTSAGRTADFVPIFHPSVYAPEDAAVITVRAGEERAGVDVVVRMMSTSAITGRILDMGDRAPAEIEVTLSKPGQFGPPAGAFRTVARSDGTFRIGGVTPGRYLLAVRAIAGDLARAALGMPERDAKPGAPTDSSCVFAAQEVQATGDDLSGISLALQPCLRIDGRLEFVSAQNQKPANLPTAVVFLLPAVASKVPMYIPIRVPATSRADAKFTLGEFGDVLPGVYHLDVTLLGSEPGKGWWLESGTAGGRDILDAPLQITTGGPARIPIVLTFSDRHTSLSGSLDIVSRRLPVEYTVVVFPTNREWWTTPFRRVKAARPAPTGQYVIHDLPPGEYYLAALSNLAPDDWRDREFLGLIVPAAIRLTIAPGEQKIQHLRIER